MTFQPAAWPPDWPEIRQSVTDLLGSGQWGRYKSPHQETLRNRLGKLVGVEFVRLCGSGSAAIEISLRAAGVAPGDAVALAAFDYPGNFRAIESVGATPVLVDVATDGLSIDPNLLNEYAAQLRASGVRAVIASHLYGRAAAIGELRKVCDQQDWVLIEDACQVPLMKIVAAGHCSMLGSFGHLATLSFGGSKPLTAGNGGAVLTNDRRMSARIATLLDRPSDSQPLSTLQAATLLPQLDRLDECNRKRNATVSFLQRSVNDQLSGWRWLSSTGDDGTATHYKVAWQCESSEQRNRIVDGAASLGLPIGAAFRSMSNSSQRRCHKPMSLAQSSDRGDKAFVLDHSALLIESDQHASLAEYLLRLNRSSA